MKCPKCNSNMVVDGDNYFCLLCGQEKPSGKVLSAAIKANAEQITTDDIARGHKAAAKKWHISRSSVYRHTRVIRRGASELTKQPEPEVSRNGAPPLPAWSDNWPEAVMVKWLDVWSRVKLT